MGNGRGWTRSPTHVILPTHTWSWTTSVLHPRPPPPSPLRPLQKFFFLTTLFDPLHICHMTTRAPQCDYLLGLRPVIGLVTKIGLGDKWSEINFGLTQLVSWNFSCCTPTDWSVITCDDSFISDRSDLPGLGTRQRLEFNYYSTGSFLVVTDDFN